MPAISQHTAMKLLCLVLIQPTRITHALCVESSRFLRLFLRILIVAVPEPEHLGQLGLFFAMRLTYLFQNFTKSF